MTTVLTFLSAPRVANCFPSGETVIHLGYVLSLTNSYRSVSHLDSKLTQVGVWKSFFSPHQYSIIPISSADMTTSYTGLYC